MRIFTDQMLKDGLEIQKVPMTYYLSEKVALESLKEAEKGAFPDADKLIEVRPFDEVILILTHTDEFGIDATTTILHVTENGEYRNFQYTPLVGFINKTIRENFTKRFESGALDMFDHVEEDREQLRLNQAAMALLLIPFIQKKTELHFCTGKALTTTNKNKYKKKNYMLVSKTGKRYLPSGGHKKLGTVVAHSVCGHTMHFHKKPDSVGSDRNGNITIGSTWRRPHTSGVGEIVINRIRLWLK